MEDNVFFVTGLVASKTLEPAVQIELNDVKTQVGCDKAREIALQGDRTIDHRSRGVRRDGCVHHRLVDEDGEDYTGKYRIDPSRIPQ